MLRLAKVGAATLATAAARRQHEAAAAAGISPLPERIVPTRAAPPAASAEPELSPAERVAAIRAMMGARLEPARWDDPDRPTEDEMPAWVAMAKQGDHHAIKIADRWSPGWAKSTHPGAEDPSQSPPGPGVTSHP